MMTRFSTWLFALALLAPGASATTFTFGDIAATDVITSITLAADDGNGGGTFIFDTSNNQITITSSVTQINFSNRAAITGIPIGDVIFSSQVTLDGSFDFSPPFFPNETSANFTNGAADFTIFDDANAMFPVKVLEGEYSGGLDVSIRVITGVVLGELSGDLQITGGDADAQAAFGPTGSIDQVFPVTTTTQTNLCGLIVTPCTPAASDWLDFEANPTSTLQATVPEPSTAVIFMLSAITLAGLRVAGGRR